MQIVGKRIVDANSAKELGAAAGSESGWYYGSISAGIFGGIFAAWFAPAGVPKLVVVPAAATTSYVAGGIIGSKVGELKGKTTGENCATLGHTPNEILEKAGKAGGVQAAVVGIGVGAGGAGVASYVAAQPQVISSIPTILDTVSKAINKIDIPSNAPASALKLIGEDAIIETT